MKIILILFAGVPSILLLGLLGGFYYLWITTWLPDFGLSTIGNINIIAMFAMLLWVTYTIVSTLIEMWQGVIKDLKDW